MANQITGTFYLLAAFLVLQTFVVLECSANDIPTKFTYSYIELATCGKIAKDVVRSVVEQFALQLLTNAQAISELDTKVETILLQRSQGLMRAETLLKPFLSLVPIAEHENEEQGRARLRKIEEIKEYLIQRYNFVSTSHEPTPSVPRARVHIQYSFTCYAFLTPEELSVDLANRFYRDVLGSPPSRRQMSIPTSILRTLLQIHFRNDPKTIPINDEVKNCFSTLINNNNAEQATLFFNRFEFGFSYD